MLRKIIISLLLVFLMVGGWWKMQTIQKEQERQLETTSHVLLEQVRKVAKLIAIEGQFSEIFSYKDYIGLDLSIFRKKALMRVQAKVSVGFDLSGLYIESFPDEKRITVSKFPAPRILGIDHELDYYDITEGTFNSFTEEDFNKINRQAKERIRQKALESKLFEMADQQAYEVLQLMGFIVTSAGWQLDILDDELLNTPSTLNFSAE